MFPKGRRRLSLTLGVVLGIVLGGGCASRTGSTTVPIPPTPQSRSIDVSLVYLQRLGLPSGAEYRAVLREVSLESSTVLAERTALTSGEQPPLRVELTFPDRPLAVGHQFVIDAWISFRGEQWFTGAVSFPAALPRVVELVLQRAP